MAIGYRGIVFRRLCLVCFGFCFSILAWASDPCSESLSALEEQVPIEPYNSDLMVLQQKQPLLTGGSIHFFSQQIQDTEGPIAGFQAFRERILLWPRTSELFGFRFHNDFIQVPDLKALKGIIAHLQRIHHLLAPSVMPYTYRGQYESPDLAVGRMWAQRKFVVSTEDAFYFKHDILNHALYGYLLLPRPIVDVVSAWGQFLVAIETHPRFRKNKVLESLAQNELKQLANHMDRMTEKINGWFMDENRPVSKLAAILRSEVGWPPKYARSALLKMARSFRGRQQIQDWNALMAIYLQAVREAQIDPDQLAAELIGKIEKLEGRSVATQRP